MNRLFSASKGSAAKRISALAAAVAGVCLSFATPAAQAKDSRDRGHDHDRDGRDNRVNVDVRIGEQRREYYRPAPPERIWCEPVYRTVCERVWVEPVYRTVCERVWCEPVTECVTERVWVPDRWEERTTIREEYGRKTRYVEKVLVDHGHYENVERRVVVSEGHWDNVERRELVSEGGWRSVERRELVSPGRWDYRSYGRSYDRDDRGFSARFEIRR